MATLKISSRLKHFKLLTNIDQCADNHICGSAVLDGLPRYTVMEAMAQLAALHVRICLDFEQHAFLLKIIDGQWPNQNPLCGLFLFTAEQLGQSQNAFSYAVKAEGQVDALILDAKLLIGTTPYSSKFEKNALRSYYQQMVVKLESQRNKSNWLSKIAPAIPK